MYIHLIQKWKLLNILVISLIGLLIYCGIILFRNSQVGAESLIFPIDGLSLPPSSTVVYSQTDIETEWLVKFNCSANWREVFAHFDQELLENNYSMTPLSAKLAGALNGNGSTVCYESIGSDYSVLIMYVVTTKSTLNAERNTPFSNFGIAIMRK